MMSWQGTEHTKSNAKISA